MDSNNLISQAVGRNLKRLRKEAGYKNSEFAKLVNKSEQQMHRYERGVNKIDLDTLIVALKILNINVGDFFTQLIDGDKEVDSMNLIFEPKDEHLNSKRVFEVETAGINY